MLRRDSGEQGEEGNSRGSRLYGPQFGEGVGAGILPQDLVLELELCILLEEVLDLLLEHLHLLSNSKHQVRLHQVLSIHHYHQQQR